MDKVKYYIFIITFFFTSSVLLILFARFIFSTPAMERHLYELFLEKNKIIYMGDSVLNADHKNNSNPSSLVNLFEQRLSLDALEISGTAFTPYIYHRYLQIIKKYNKETNLIIIPINLRAFSSSWNRVPIYQFEQECSALSLINFNLDFMCIKEHIKNLLNAKRVDNKYDIFLNEKITSEGFLKDTKRRFFKNIKNNCYLSEKNNKQVVNCKHEEDFQQIVDYLQHQLTVKQAMMAMRFNYHYAEHINKENGSLLALREVVDIANNSEFKILFYYTPLNLEAILRYSGKKVLNIIKNNIDTINNEIKGKNIYTLNLINILSENHFDLDCACEHIDLEGKKKLVNHLSEYIKFKTENK